MGAFLGTCYLVPVLKLYFSLGSDGMGKPHLHLAELMSELLRETHACLYYLTLSLQTLKV